MSLWQINRHVAIDMLVMGISGRASKAMEVQGKAVHPKLK